MSNRNSHLNNLRTMDDYRAQADGMFSSYDGLEYGADANFYGADDESNYGGMGDESDFNGQTAGQGGVRQIGKNAARLKLTVRNASTTDVKAVKIFGSYVNTGSTYGLPVDVTIQSATASYAQIMEQIKTQPIAIEGIRIDATGTNAAVQLTETLRLATSAMTGGSSSEPYFMDKSPFQQDEQVIIDDEFKMIADGNHWIEFNLQPGTNVTLTFYIKASVNVSQVLAGNGNTALSVAKPSAKPSTLVPALVKK